MIFSAILLATAHSQLKLTAQNTGIYPLSTGTQKTCLLNTTFINQTTSSIRTSYNSTFLSLYQNNSVVVFVRGALTTGNIDITVLMKNISKTALDGVALVAYIIVPLALFLLLVPFLICCCCCDDKCPLQCLCRKDAYTGWCDKYTCPVLALLFTLVLLGTCTAGVVVSFSMANSIAQLECQALTLLESLNGGIINNATNTFFVGLGPATDKITSLGTSLNGLITRVNLIPGKVDAVSNAYTAYNTNMNNNYNGFTNPTYTNAFYNSDGTTAFSVTSEFKELYLGPATNTNSVYGTTKKFMDAANNGISPALT
jgi:hypothetical protein